MSQSKPSAQAPPLRSESQSLFNIYYLGHTVVDRRCSSSVMPWIIEEMKVKAAKMRFVWLTPGTDQVTYVADNGQELFSHTYGSILQCCIAIDGISFAYIARREKDNKYLCHVFQALTYEEAASIMNKFKKHAKEEVSVGSTVSRSATSPADLKKSSGLIFHPPSASQTTAAASNHGRASSREDTKLCEYCLEYVGKFEVPSPATSSENQVETVDNIVAKLRENQSNGSFRAKPKRRSLSAMLKGIGKTSSTNVRDSDSIDGMAASNSATSLLDEGGATSLDAKDSQCSLTLQSHDEEEEEEEGGGENSTDLTVTITATSSEEELLTSPTNTHRSVSQTDVVDANGYKEEDGTPTCNLSEPLSGRDQEKEGEKKQNGAEEMKAALPNGSLPGGSGGSGELEATGKKDGQKRDGVDVPDGGGGSGLGVFHASSDSVSSEFDTLPELANLRDSYAFQALSHAGQQTQKVKLVFSGLMVTMFAERGEEQLLRLHVRNISCCAQGSKEGEYVGFTSREGKGSKKYSCHLLLAQSKKQGSKVLESFRAAFAHALSVSMPAALCDSCPLRQLHQLCRTLEGVSTQVGQSRIQECLSTLSEADYSKIMKQYKASEHATQEFTQIVMLVALLRHHFQKQQESHTHRGIGTVRSAMEETSSRLKLPAFARAKNALASSIDNLRTRQQNNNNQTGKKEIKASNGSGSAVAVGGEDRASQSLTLPVHSPIFTRKAKLDDLMAPIAMSPSPSSEKKLGGSRLPAAMRERSWSDRLQKRKLRELSVVVDGSPPDNSEKEKGEKDKKKKTKGSSRTPPSPPATNKDELSTPKRSRSPSPLTIIPPTMNQKRPDNNNNNLQMPRRAPMLGLKGTRSKRSSRTPPAQMASSPMDLQLRRGHRRSTSYTCRAEIFESVNTPERRGSYDMLEEFEIIEPSAIDQLGTRWQSPEDKKAAKKGGKEEETQQSPRTRARQRWRHAIKQQIILNQMEKKNELVKQASTEADLKRLKLCYTDPHFQSVEAEATEMWNKILIEEEQNETVILKALIQGVPPKRRAEVWQFLSFQYQAKSGAEYEFQPSLATKEGFMQLCEEKTSYEHNIYVDIGRTFPSHPYFASSLKHGGQATLRKILHAYAVADQETGYCQGVSFVAGMILMHCKDELSSFKFLHMLMQLYSYRDVYAMELSNLQMMLYQLSRLLHDLNPNLYHLLKENEVTPFYYAAPWFLTLFASQYPIAFCARVLDLFFYEGPNIVFKIALALLNLHEDQLHECRNMETTCAFLKNKLPDLVLNKMPAVFEEAMKIDLGDRLATFGAEYEVMSELSRSAFTSHIYVSDLESVNMVLRKQNSALIEQLAICHGSIRRLESMVLGLQQQLEDQKEVTSRLVATVHGNSPGDDQASQSEQPLTAENQPS